MKWICSKCGEVKPTNIGYSCPAVANCPNCNEDLVDPEGGIKILSLEESVRKRPSMFKDIEKGHYRLTDEELKKVKEILKQMEEEKML